MSAEWLTPCRRAGEPTAHLRDPDVKPDRGRGAADESVFGTVKNLAPDATLGATICGLPLDVEELWVEASPSHRRCGACSSGTVADEQEMLM